MRDRTTPQFAEGCTHAGWLDSCTAASWIPKPWRPRGQQRSDCWSVEVIVDQVPTPRSSGCPDNSPGCLHHRRGQRTERRSPDRLAAGQTSRRTRRRARCLAKSMPSPKASPSAKPIPRPSTSKLSRKPRTRSRAGVAVVPWRGYLVVLDNMCSPSGSCSCLCGAGERIGTTKRAVRL